MKRMHKSITFMIAGFLVVASFPMSPSMAVHQESLKSQNSYTSLQDNSIDSVTVVSRNIYLGADVGVAMKLLPNFPAATQFMWDQMLQNDFSRRAVALATEIEAQSPDVIGIQEATTWICQAHPWNRKVVVYDFLEMLQQALADKGLNYEVPAVGGKTAYNIGFAIDPIPMLTVAKDENTLMSLFGTNSASCGFRIADALLVRKSLVNSVSHVGSVEFEKTYSVIPALMTVHRGYVWADISVGGVPVRFVTTHLESLFDGGQVPHAAVQAEQLIQDLSSTKMPLIVMGDFNSDSRDPRPRSDANLGGQPYENDKCPAQVENVTLETAHVECNAYWLMRQAGFADAGPDGNSLSWGYSALLDGPEESRPEGFTDRLDYVFTKNFETNNVLTSSLFGTILSGVQLGAPVTSTGAELDLLPGAWECGAKLCAASDHAGVVAKIALPVNATADLLFPPPHTPSPITPIRIVVTLLIAVVVWRFTSRLRKKIV